MFNPNTWCNIRHLLGKLLQNIIYQFQLWKWFSINLEYIHQLYKTISRGEIDQLYFETIVTTNVRFTTSSVRVEHTITIPPGNYTELGLSQVIDQQLRNESKLYMGSAYDSANNVCSISTWSFDIKFRILAPDEIIGSRTITSPNTINEILNNIVPPSPTYDINNGMTINRLRLQPIHNIYIYIYISLLLV